jgi:hypothetical protein
MYFHRWGISFASKGACFLSSNAETLLTSSNFGMFICKNLAEVCAFGPEILWDSKLFNSWYFAEISSHLKEDSKP